MRSFLLLVVLCFFVAAANAEFDFTQFFDTVKGHTNKGDRHTPVTMNEKGFGPETALNWAEYIPVHNQKYHMWYWFFEAREAPENAPLILWMTGGPGCSSLVALFNENGPYHIQEDLSLKLNPHSWNKKANILFIDQPVGTGFSYSDFGEIGVVSEKQMAQAMYEFFQGFFAKYPQYQENPFFVTGESYAGHYIPALSARIHEGNLNKEGIHINLKGLAIGNGLVDPVSQYPEYSNFALQHGIVGETVYNGMRFALPACLTFIRNCAQTDPLHWASCTAAYYECMITQVMPVQLQGLNMYDVREKCNPDLPLCYNFTLVDAFLEQEEVVEALNVKKGRGWKDCNHLVNLKMVLAGDWMISLKEDVKTLLHAGIPVVVYNGEYDFICNWMGSQAWTQQLQWDGADEFAKAENTTWTVNGEFAGTAVSAQGLTFLRVKDAGHMVPLDQPENALDMIMRVVNNLPFRGD